MIFVYHNTTKVIAVESNEGQSMVFDTKSTIAGVLWILAQQFESETLVWCHFDYKQILNKEDLNTFFHHNKLLLSYSPGASSYFGNMMGYIEESLFVNGNKKTCFPTWQMSSAVGLIHASVVLKVNEAIPFQNDFDYYLNSLAKLCMPLGLFCYSEPKLFKELPTQYFGNQAKITTIFKFVKQHYKTRWLFLLMLNRWLYEGKISFVPFLSAFFYRKRKSSTINLDSIEVKSSKVVINKKTIDVIIPTIGRKRYLQDILNDLAQQTHLPVNVIIVEQNPQPGSVSELDFLTNQTWPFVIKHTFTHQAGACNARNLALSQVESEWVFLADDDIRIKKDFVEKALERIRKLGAEAVSLSCLREGENKWFNAVFQWGSFGSGCSIVATKLTKEIRFNIGFEFGFGEDSDFGMQLRNQGVDVLYLPEPEILHLKAPMGGFRTKPELEWQTDTIQPKPSPTVMLYQIRHNTKQQISGYKTILFFKYYKNQRIKNPLKYYINFQKQWKRSVFWANELNKK